MKWIPFEQVKMVLNRQGEYKPSGVLKDFAAQLPKHEHISFHTLGMAAVPIEKIVGSVGRAHDLDKRFRYRGRAITERYQQAMVTVSNGEPSQPIKVYKLKRPRASSEYYVFDGHHRLAAAIQQGYNDINAVVTEVQIHATEN
mgnify:CR=1 FL=1